MATPATDPAQTAVVWYVCSPIPTASVHELGTASPTTCPAITMNAPRWNSGLPQRSQRCSRSWLVREVQPNWSCRYRHTWPTANTARQTYGTATHSSRSAVEAFMRGLPRGTQCGWSVPAGEG